MSLFRPCGLKLCVDSVRALGRMGRVGFAALYEAHIASENGGSVPSKRPRQKEPSKKREQTRQRASTSSRSSRQEIAASSDQTTKRRKRDTPTGCHQWNREHKPAIQDFEATLGSVEETDAAHVKRCKARRLGSATACARCIWITHKVEWNDSCGSFLVRDGMGGSDLRKKGHKRGKPIKAYWIGTRPAHHRGVWGLGCIVCAAALHRVNASAHKLPAEMKRKFSTKWSRYEIRSPLSMQASLFKQHSQTDIHKQALTLWMAPEQAVTAALVPRSDVELLRGKVPQESDWLLAWRSVRTPTSFRAAAFWAATENFISSRRLRELSRRAFANMIQVMASVCRSKKQLILLESSSITLILDDRRDYRVVRFSADRVPTKEDKETYNHTGILGVIHAGAGLRPADFNEDHAQNMAMSVLQCIQTFSSEADDPAILERHILQHTRIIVADGGPEVQKAARILFSWKASFPQLALLHRDHCHRLRISMFEPLKRQEMFHDMWSTLLHGGRGGALIPAVQYSVQWQARLISSQKHVQRLRRDDSEPSHVERDSGGRDSIISSILRHFSIAEQRYDSVTGPLRKYCALFVPVAAMLSQLVDDPRVARDKKSLARRTLEGMTPVSLVTAALAADYSSCCSRFLRLFDTGSHDPALTADELEKFRAKMESLFSEGKCIRAAEDSTAQSSLGIVWQQLEERWQFHFDGQVKFLEPPSHEQCEDCFRQLKGINVSMLRRLKAELDDDLTLAFSCFQLSAWRFLAKANKEEWVQLGLGTLRKSVTRLTQAFRLAGSQDATYVQQHFENAAFGALVVASDLAQKQNIQEKDLDNRQVWVAWIGTQDTRSDKNRFEDIVLMLIRIYISFQDSSSQVERDLGVVAKMLLQHMGPLQELGVTTLNDLVHLHVDGPKQEEELFTHARSNTKQQASSFFSHPSTDGTDVLEEVDVPMTLALPEGSDLQMTDWTRQCAKRWIEKHGRRCQYKLRVDAGVVKPKRVGTDAHMRRSQALALDEAA